MDDLPLQIRKVNDIEIHEADGADTGCCQIHRRGCAEAARADDEHLAIEQLLLSLATNLLQDDVSRVTLELRIREIAHRAPPPMK